MEHRNAPLSTEAISATESQLIALIAAIAIEQAIAETTRHSHAKQKGNEA